MSTRLKSSVEINIRFNEVDSLGIVWHGHYLKYFEDARENFGKEFGLGYLDIFREGFVTPLVKVECDYKNSLVYGDVIEVDIEYHDSQAAKIQFGYAIHHADTGVLIATGSSLQVFLDVKDRILQLSCPDFFIEWKKRHGLI